MDLVNVGSLGLQWDGSLSGAINDLTSYVPIWQCVKTLYPW